MLSSLSVKTLASRLSGELAHSFCVNVKWEFHSLLHVHTTKMLSRPLLRLSKAAPRYRRFTTLRPLLQQRQEPTYQPPTPPTSQEPDNPHVRPTPPLNICFSLETRPRSTDTPIARILQIVRKTHSEGFSDGVVHVSGIALVLVATRDYRGER